MVKKYSDNFDADRLESAEKCIEMYFVGGSLEEVRRRCKKYIYQALSIYSKYRGIFRKFEGVNGDSEELKEQIKKLRAEIAELRAVVRDLIRVVEPLRRRV